MPADRPLPLWAGRTAALLGILLVALNLRTVVAALSPILGLVSHDVALSPVVIGVIGAAPPLMFALAGLITPRLSARLGLEVLLVIAVAAMVLGQFIRAFSPNSAVLVVATALALLGAGVGNVLLPPLVKRYFPDRLTQVTSLYAVLIAFSTSLPALTAVPVAESVGWRASLLVWAALALTALIPWIIASRARSASLGSARGSDDHDGVEPQPQPEPERVPGNALFRSPVAWAVMVTFLISSISVYAAFAWLPTLLVETAHVSATTAGTLLALYGIIGFPNALIVPVIAARLKNVSLLVYLAGAALVISDLGLLLVPTVATALWVIVGGFGTLLFPLALLLINRRTRTHAGSVALSGFVQGIGYLLAAASPLAFGLLHQATGGWSASILLLLVLSLACIPAGIILTRPRYLEDDLATRARSAG